MHFPPHDVPVTPLVYYHCILLFTSRWHGNVVKKMFGPDTGQPHNTDGGPKNCYSTTEPSHPNIQYEQPFYSDGREQNLALNIKLSLTIDTVTATQHIVACCSSSSAYRAHYSLSIIHFSSQGFLKSGHLSLPDCVRTRVKTC